MPQLRMRTVSREGKRPGQPETIVTSPKVRHRDLGKHWCGECFRPRSALRQSLFCASCDVKLFGLAGIGYRHFIRSERSRQVHQANRIRRSKESSL